MTNKVDFKQWFEAGYRDLLPVVPPDAHTSPTSHVAAGKGKSPGVKYASGLWGGFQGWNTHVTTEQDIESWQRMGASIGLRFGAAWLLDLDIYDQDTADAVEAAALDMLGPAPMRVGQWPKRALLYSNDGTLKPQKLKFAGKQGEVNLIEIPPQAVVMGTHAKTGRPYEWRRPLLKFDKLTVVSADALASFMKAMRAKLPSASSVEGAGDSDVNQATLAGNVDVVSEILTKLPNPATMRWDDMIKLGYATKAALPDAPDLAFDLWDEWCARWEADGYDQGVARVRWDTLKGPFRIGADWLYELGDKMLGEHNQFEAKAKLVDLDASSDAENPFTLKQSEDAQRTYTLLGIHDIITRPAPRWMLARHIPVVGVGFLYSEPGMGKSFLALDIALHIAFGFDRWHGDAIDVPADTMVLYIAAEGSYGFRNRIKAWMKHHQVDANPERFKMIEQTINFMKPEDIAQLLRTVRQVAGLRPCLIVVDTVSRAMPGADENLQKEMTLFVSACDTLRDAFRCAVLGVHHAGKSGDMRGSTVLRGAGDFVFRLVKKKEATVGLLACEKQKDGPDGWEEPYRFETVGLGEGETSLVVERAEIGLGGADVALTPELAERVLGAMRSAWEAGEPWAKAPQTKERYAVRRMVADYGLNAVAAEETLRMWETAGLIRLETISSRNKKAGFKVGDLGQAVRNEGIFA